ncbi:MAG TPA: hypothetical protein VG275_12665 [Solirubrobacteraceae bacterium]|jgi:photosystem II stability/assembly factor-like uncharacterized protein|nr:hypothetical protein [Solirubrobacteraceae bacterium]
MQRPAVISAGCSRPAASLSALAFPTPVDGWVLAAQSDPSGELSGLDVLATRDSGSTWSCQWQRPITPEQIVAVDPHHAWILGRQGGGCKEITVSRQCRAVIMRTTDGARWSTVDRPLQGITQLAFASRALGLAAAHDLSCGEPGGLPPTRCAGQVLLSDDGGRYWHVVLRAPDPIVAVAIEHGTFWAIETRLGVASRYGRQQGVTVLASHDAGRSWRREGALNMWLASLHQQVQLLVGAHHQLWLSLLDLDGCAMHGCGPDDLWRSDDGGRTWKLSDPEDRAEGFSSAGCGISGSIVLALEDASAWAVDGPPQATCERPAATLFHLSPPGAQRAGVAWAVARRWASFRPIALAWPTRSVGYALGATGLARSNDAGRDWVQILPAPSPAVTLDAISAATSYGVQEATEEGAVLATTDGGDRWNVLADLPMNVTSVDLLGSKVGFAVGAAWLPTTNEPSWRLYASLSGGRSWRLRSTLPLTPGQQVDGLWMAGPTRGLMLVASGYIWPQAVSGVAPAWLWQTDDGGETWSKLRSVPLPFPQVLGGVSFTATGDRWVGWVTADGGLEQSTDSGRTWHAVPRAPSLDEIKFVTPSFGVGWSGPHNGRILLWRSTDAGLHWSRLPLPAAVAASASSPVLPVSASFANPRAGWLLADGALWRTNDGGQTWHRAGPTAFGG